MHNPQPTQGHNPHRICTTGYIVGIEHNPRRLSRDDNGYCKVFLGNQSTVYMLTIIKDTPAE